MATRTVSLQDEHLTATRRRILDATVELIVEEHVAALSMPAVAARAGVSVRTVYRHFATKDALLEALADLGDEGSRATYPEGGMTVDNIDELLPPLWRELMGTRALTLAQYATPLGQQLRLQRGKRRIADVRRAVDQAGLVLDDEERRRLESIIAVLVNRTTLFEMTDVQGLSAEDAATTVAWACRVLVDAMRQKEGPGG